MAEMTAVPFRADGRRARILQRMHIEDLFFRMLTQTAASIALLLLAGVILALAAGAWPALKAFGLNFFVAETWNPVTDHYGAAAAIYGTVISSLIALLIAVPVGIGIAIFLTELSPEPLKRPLGVAIELLAGIPSIIYGIWGFFVFAPFMQNHLEPWLIFLFGRVPVLHRLFEGPPFGIGMLAAGLILSIMILPFIVTVTRDVFETVPPMLRESAFGLGCTTWEVVRNVTIPYTRNGIAGGVMLALGRALGETMAVTFVIGNAHQISLSLLHPGTTISAAIANEFTEATTPLYISALIALGLVLFLITFVVLALARLLRSRLEGTAGVRR